MLCSRILRAPGGIAAGAWIVLSLTAVGASAVVPPGATVEEFDLSTLDRPSKVGTGADVDLLTLDAAPPTDPAAVPVPLPPALATGLVGLAAMVVLRVGQRVYRRR